MSATIRDVAKHAGVSPSTVSRVIARNPRISPSTSQRVSASMQLLNYVPNAIARSLANSLTKTIGFTMARPADQAFANPFFGELMRGIATVSQRRGYKLLLSMSSNQDWEIQDCMQMVREKRVDGLILSTVRIEDPLVNELLMEQVPFVVIGRSLQHDVPMVNNDNILCGQLAAQHLLDLGRKRIALVTGPRDLVVSEDRIRGYTVALKKAGIDPLPELIVETEFSREGGHMAMEVLASQAIDGVVAADDVIALGVIEWLQKQGVAVPEGVAVVGFNDDPVAAYVNPSLTTVRISTHDLGLNAAHMLLDTLEGKPDVPRKIIVPANLVVRRST